MKVRKNFMPAFLLLFIFILGACSPGNSNGGDGGSTVQRTITFSDLMDGEDPFPLDAMPAEGDLMFLETRAPQLKNREDGTEYTLNRSSGLDGTIAYTFESSEEPIQESDIEVTVPVLYVEVPADETLTIPLNGASDLIDIEVKDDANGLVLSFTSMDLYHLPYDLVLISGGDAYDNFGVSYYFDPETGDFTNAELTFPELLSDDLAENAYLETSSMLNRYVPESYSLSE